MDTQKEKEKVIVILGPTASGKTSLSIDISLEFNGEVISADSRQVYRGCDIGTEKVTSEEMRGIPHHLIDVADPQDIFTVEEFKTMGRKTINDIVSRNKLPVIAGGTGFYIDNLVHDITMPEVPPNQDLREELEDKTAEELFEILKEKDLRRSATIDPNNKRRLIRSLEIIEAIGLVPEQNEPELLYDVLYIGIQTDTEVLKKRIKNRLTKTLLEGLVEETKKLHTNGVSWERMNELGLEYKIAGQYIRNEISEEEMRTLMIQELWRYVKRQRTWFKRNKNIEWFTLSDVDEIKKRITTFLK